MKKLLQWGMQHGKVILLGAAVAFVATCAGYIMLRIKRAEAERDRLAAALVDAEGRADSLVAAADTTRLVAALATRWGDSIQVYARRVVQQATWEADSVDQLLRIERRAKAELELRVRALSQGRDTSFAVGGPDSLAADFTVRQEPYTVQARAVLVPPPVPSRLTVDVTLDPLELGVRVGCGQPEAGATFRSATVGVTAPPWATVGVRSVEQDRAVCNPPVVVKQGGGKVVAAGAGLVTGFLLALLGFGG